MSLHKLRTLKVNLEINAKTETQSLNGVPPSTSHFDSHSPKMQPWPRTAQTHSYHFMTRVESGSSVFIPFGKMQGKALSGPACITCLNFRTVTKKGKEGIIRKDKDDSFLPQRT